MSMPRRDVGVGALKGLLYAVGGYDGLLCAIGGWGTSKEDLKNSEVYNPEIASDTINLCNLTYFISQALKN